MMICTVTLPHLRMMKPVWPDRLIYVVRLRFFSLDGQAWIGPSQKYVSTALERVQAELEQLDGKPNGPEQAGGALSEEPVDLYGHLDALRGDIYELCNTALCTASEAAEYVLEEVYEDTEYTTSVRMKEDLTATVTQYANLEDDGCPQVGPVEMGSVHPPGAGFRRHAQ